MPFCFRKRFIICFPPHVVRNARSFLRASVYGGSFRRIRCSPIAEHVPPRYWNMSIALYAPWNYWGWTLQNGCAEYLRSELVEDNNSRSCTQWGMHAWVEVLPCWRLYYGSQWKSLVGCVRIGTRAEVSHAEVREVR